MCGCAFCLIYFHWFDGIISMSQIELIFENISTLTEIM